MALTSEEPLVLRRALVPPLVFSYVCSACLFPLYAEPGWTFWQAVPASWMHLIFLWAPLFVGAVGGDAQARAQIDRACRLGSLAGLVGLAWGAASGSLSRYLGWVPASVFFLSVFIPRSKAAPPVDWPALAKRLKMGSDERVPARASAPVVGERLVEAGRFRVDPAKALEKLGRFQSGRADSFLRCWLRLAVASDARHVSLDASWWSLRVAFDGKPLSEGALDDPFGALFEGGGDDDERGGFLAYGVLGALRDGARAIRISSGAGERRRTFSVGRDAADAEGAQTVLEVSWGSTRLGRPAALVANARDAFFSPTAELRVGGRPWDPGLRSADWVRKPIPGGLALGHRGPLHPPGRICLYKRGIRTDELFDESGREGWEIHLECPDLTLDVAQESSVHNLAYEAAVSAARAAAERWT